MKKFRLVCLLLALCLISSSFVGVTFAKYTSTGSGTDSGRIAAWGFVVNDNDMAVSNTFTFDLYNTVYDTKVASSTEGDVLADASTAIIAPGTWGYFDIVVRNNSEVNATYDVTFKSTEGGCPVKYHVENISTGMAAPTAPASGDWYDGIEVWNDVADVTETLPLNMSGCTETIRVFWKWDFEGNDIGDTELGKAAALAKQIWYVTATITATQVD